MKLAVAVGAAVLLVAATLMVAPALLADRVWLAASDRLAGSAGVRMSASGPVRFQLLPSPRLTATEVQASLGDGAVARAAGLAAELKLARGGIEFESVTLRQLRLTGLPDHPPTDVTVAMAGSAMTATATFDGGRLTAAARPQDGNLAIESFDLDIGGVAARGSANVIREQGTRLVLAAERIAYGGSELGRGALAVTFASDGALIERAALQMPVGIEVALFGLASAEAGGVRFEGGAEALASGLAPVEASARLNGSFGPAQRQIEISDIAVRAAGSALTGHMLAQHAGQWKATAELRLDKIEAEAVPRLLPALAPLLAFEELGLRLRVGRLAWSGNAAEGIVLDLARSGATGELKELAVRSLAGTPARATGRLEVAPGRLTFSSLALKMGAAELNGTLAVELGGGMPRLAADLSSHAPLGYDSFFPPLPALPPEPMTRRAAAAQAAAPRQPPRRTTWDTAPLSLPVLPAAEGSLRLAAPAFVWRNHRLSEAQLALQTKDGELIIDSLSGGIYGGRVEARGRASAADGIPRFAMAATVAGADLRALLMEQAGVGEITGRVDATLQATTAGRSQAELVSALNGRIEIKGRDGQVSGFDLPAMSNGLKRLNRPTDLFQAVQMGLGGGRTPFQRLDGTFNVVRGVARTDDLRLVAAAGEARMTGTINLPAWTMDLTNEARLSEHPDLPPLVFKLNGSVEAPRRVFDFAALQAQLVRRGRR